MSELTHTAANKSIAAQRDRARQPSSDPVDRLTVLCERVRDLAASTAHDAIDAARRRADALMAEATLQAEVAYHEHLRKAKERLQKHLDRQLQNARLEARARFESSRWETLTAALDEADQRILSMRDAKLERYSAALVRFVKAACQELACERAVVFTSAAEIGPLRQRWQQFGGHDVEVKAGDIAAGVMISRTDGTAIVDHSIVRRRQRCDAQLRLAASEILFGDGKHDAPRQEDAQ